MCTLILTGKAAVFAGKDGELVLRSEKDAFACLRRFCCVLICSEVLIIILCIYATWKYTFRV